MRSWIVIFFLLTDFSCQGYRYRALLSHDTADKDGEQVLWGCEPTHANLKANGVHVVVASFDADPVQWLPWAWHLGLTQAHVFIYHRQPKALPWPGITNVTLPCGMKLHIEQLVPNRGREAAVYLHHLITHYAELPAALWLIHDHGPASRHSMCGPFMRRTRAFYRGLVANAKQAAKQQQKQARTEQRGLHGEGTRGEVGQVEEDDLHSRQTAEDLQQTGTPLGVSHSTGLIPSAAATLAQHDAHVIANVSQRLAGVVRDTDIDRVPQHPERGGRPARGGPAAGALQVGMGGGMLMQAGALARRKRLAHCLHTSSSSSSGTDCPGLRSLYAKPAKGQSALAPVAATASETAMFGQFARLSAVTLSSGCLERWARGCCSTFLCSNTSACPFQGHSCVSSLPNNRRWMHRSSLYDFRFENRVVGWAPGSPYDGQALVGFDMTVVRYMSTAQDRSRKSWEPQHEYQASFAERNLMGQAQRQQAQRQAALHTAQDRAAQRQEAPEEDGLKEGGEGVLPGLEERDAKHGADDVGGTGQLLDDPNQVLSRGEREDGGRQGGEEEVAEILPATGVSKPKIRSKQDTLDRLWALLRPFGVEERAGNVNFKSCCASLIVRKETIRIWPQELYQTLFDYATDPTNHYEATKAVATPAWRLWGGPRNITESELFLYHEVDVALSSIKGCPGPSAEVMALLQKLQQQAPTTAARAQGSQRTSPDL